MRWQTVRIGGPVGPPGNGPWRDWDDRFVIVPPFLLLTVYSVGIVAAAVLGIWVQRLVALTHARMQVVISFVAGLILGVALLHLIPHSIDQIPGDESSGVATWWVAVGMLLMVFLLRVSRFHQHEAAAGGPPGSQEEVKGSLGWLGVAAGLGVHSLTEGTALGASVRSGLQGGSEGALASLGMFLAIVCHKPLDSFSMLGLMKVGGIGFRTAAGAAIAIALLCPLSAFLAFWGTGLFGPYEGAVTGRVLAFGAGTILSISLSDLLPEIHFHGHDRVLLSASLLVGVLLAYGLRFLEHLPLVELVR